MNFEQIKELGEQGQQAIKEAYRKGALDFYNATRCMSDKEREVYVKSFIEV